MEKCEGNPEKPSAHLKIDEKQEANENVYCLWPLGRSFLAAFDAAALQQARDRGTSHHAAWASCNTSVAGGFLVHALLGSCNES